MKKDNKGFSLVELIIVIAIMAVLIGILAPQYLKFVRRSKVSTDITNAEEIATAVNAAIADDAITMPAASSTITLTGAGTTGNLVSDVPNIASVPDSKLQPPATGNSTWVVTVDEYGVKQITLEGTQIWPEPQAPWTN